MIRKGSLVMLDAEKVSNHPVYRTLVGKRWKVDGIEGKTHAMIGDVRLPVAVLVGIPQKKGKQKSA